MCDCRHGNQSGRRNRNSVQKMLDLVYPPHRLPQRKHKENQKDSRQEDAQAADHAGEKGKPTAGIRSGSDEGRETEERSRNRLIDCISREEIVQGNQGLGLDQVLDHHRYDNLSAADDRITVTVE